MQPRAILFDLGDTLIRLGPLARELTMNAARILAVAGVEPARAVVAADRAFTRLERDAIAALGSGRGEELDPAAIIAKALDIEGVAASDALVAAIADLIGYEDLDRFETLPSTVASVRDLRDAGHRMAIVSNTLTSPRLLDGYLEQAGILDCFDVRVYSVALGWKKPDPRMYGEALRRLGVEAAESVFVGDRIREDVLGPRSVGIHGILTHEFRQESVGAVPGLPVIRSVGELPGYLERL